jgi:hypothetical protein
MATLPPPNKARIGKLIRAAKKLAKEYRHVTGRPLGVTGEVAEYEAAHLLGLELAPPRQAGYDVFRSKRGGKGIDRLQVKGRCVDENRSQRMGRVSFKHPWEGVLLVLLDQDLEPTAIYEARRLAIEKEIHRTPSKARRRGALSVSDFMRIGKRLWPS